MTQPLVFDASALVALFEAHDLVYRLWERANAGEALIVVPTAAIADANGNLTATHDSWSAVLWPNDVVTTPLTEDVAIEIGPWSGGLATRHVVYEAQAVRGIVVTRAPREYDAWTIPLLAV